MADAVIEDIKNRLNIVDVLSGYIQLKRAGSNYKAVCPFHNEKSASLMVSPAKQIWHCFGCGEGGDVFGFITRYENLEFRDALKLLADRAGVVLPQRSGVKKEDSGLKDKLLRINKFAAAYYHQQLFTAQGKAALEYVTNRGLTQETITAWQIGFAPPDFHALEKALAKKGVGAQELVQSGVSVRADNGTVYDRFRNRITFPILNYVGDVVGFSARALPGEDQTAKYINSPETLIYNKSTVLFGLYFAKNDIRKNDNAVIVEGQLDCITPHQAGFRNVVASSGTALTEQHLRQIGRLTKNLKFCFDTDKAGKAAAKRAGELALSLGFAVKVVRLPSGKDPDELIRKNPQAWKTALVEAVWFIDYFIEQALTQFTPNSLEQKKYVGEQVIPLLQYLQDPLELDHYVKKLAQSFGLTETALVQSLAKMSSAATQANQQLPSREALVTTSSREALEKQVLGGLLMYKEFLAEYRSFLKPEDFSVPQVKDLAVRLLSGESVQNLLDETLAKEAQFMVESELDLLGGTSAGLLNTLRKNAYSLRLFNIKRSQEILADYIRAAESAHDAARLKELTVSFAELTQQRLALENKINNK